MTSEEAKLRMHVLSKGSCLKGVPWQVRDANSAQALVACGLTC
eukprot:CAMPEP_0179189244 /NCGR_PEP_ID=MMETSP0796-20121207/93940_1 /TAXON_ID=73915 /ORGANISM="Pyrodinium bahamense, Strain pbaha01" /LENGTH=42 /DNA_ID= /DNA_START= /DNA_END= /DNA_ORIENTATION=